MSDDCDFVWVGSTPTTLTLVTDVTRLLLYTRVYDIYQSVIASRWTHQSWWLFSLYIHSSEQIVFYWNVLEQNEIIDINDMSPIVYVAT